MEGVQIYKVLFAFVVVATHSSMATQNEDVCVKFGCMEQLLEKLIRLELKVKENGEEIAKNHVAFKISRKIQNQKLEELVDLCNARKAIPLVAFSAYNPLPAHISTNQVIKFNSVPLNEGNAYTSSSGNFIVPVDGLYEFNAHICNGRGKYIVFAIICDHTELAVSTQWDDTDSCGSVNALAILKAGEKVFVSCTLCVAGTVIYENIHRRNSFTGVLLHTDG